MIPSRYRGIEKTQKEVNAVLEQIRGEIVNLDNLNPNYLSDGRYTIDKTKVLRIIDKYKAERW